MLLLLVGLGAGTFGVTSTAVVSASANVFKIARVKPLFSPCAQGMASSAGLNARQVNSFHSRPSFTPREADHPAAASRR